MLYAVIIIIYKTPQRVKTPLYVIVIPSICNSGTNNNTIFKINKKIPMVVIIANNIPIKNIILNNFSAAGPVIY